MHQLFIVTSLQLLLPVIQANFFSVPRFAIRRKKYPHLVFHFSRKPSFHFIDDMVKLILQCCSGVMPTPAFSLWVCRPTPLRGVRSISSASAIFELRVLKTPLLFSFNSSISIFYSSNASTMLQSVFWRNKVKGFNKLRTYWATTRATMHSGSSKNR